MQQLVFRRQDGPEHLLGRLGRLGRGQVARVGGRRGSGRLRHGRGGCDVGAGLQQRLEGVGAVFVAVGPGKERGQPRAVVVVLAGLVVGQGQALGVPLGSCGQAHLDNVNVGVAGGEMGHHHTWFSWEFLVSTFSSRTGVYKRQVWNKG